MHSANQFVTPLHVQLKDFLLYEQTFVTNNSNMKKETKFSHQFLNCLLPENSILDIISSFSFRVVIATWYFSWRSSSALLLVSRLIWERQNWIPNKMHAYTEKTMAIMLSPCIPHMPSAHFVNPVSVLVRWDRAHENSPLAARRSEFDDMNIIAEILTNEQENVPFLWGWDHFPIALFSQSWPAGFPGFKQIKLHQYKYKSIKEATFIIYLRSPSLRSSYIYLNHAKTIKLASNIYLFFSFLLDKSFTWNINTILFPCCPNLYLFLNRLKKIKQQSKLNRLK